MINGHGNNLYDYTGKINADFSSNIAFNNHSAQIINHLKNKIELITNYPDPTARILTKKLAQHHNIPPAQILVTNGSAEAFYLVAHLFQRANTLICTPAFAEYEDACKTYNHNITFHPLAALSNLPSFSNISQSSTQVTQAPASLSKARAIIRSINTLWLGTPNNPDGWLTSPETLSKLCRDMSQKHIIVDRAYHTLTCDSTAQTNSLITPSTFNSIPNLITIHSLTKTFAIPGLRLGYIIANSEIISKLKQMRPPWSVNTLSLEAGAYILDHYHSLFPSIKELIQESYFLQKSLAQIPEIEVTPSNCNFFLSKIQYQTAAYLKEKLITEYGILIRDCSNFRGLSPFHFRIAAQNRSQNEALIQALQNILQP